jgi:hypothetical protein
LTSLVWMGTVTGSVLLSRRLDNQSDQEPRPRGALILLVPSNSLGDSDRWFLDDDFHLKFAGICGLNKQKCTKRSRNLP